MTENTKDPLGGLRGESQSEDDELLKYMKAKQLGIFTDSFEAWLKARKHVISYERA